MEQLTLGDRELDVMAALWQSGSGTVTEVRDALDADLAYTTVLTILRNLESKGFVRHEPRGKAHLFFPVVARRSARRSAIKRVLDKLFQGSHEELLTHLVEEQGLTPAQLRRLSGRVNPARAAKRRKR
jgi:predicted transcriptional regulator